MPPVEVILADVDDADDFRLKGAALSKAKTEGVSHLYFNACLTLSTRYLMATKYFLIIRFVTDSNLFIPEFASRS